MKIKDTKLKYIFIGILFALIFYIIGYTYINSIMSNGRGGLGVIALAYPLALPCIVFNLNKLGSTYLCFTFNLIFYLFLGALIGFLVYKIKNPQ